MKSNWFDSENQSNLNFFQAWKEKNFLFFDSFDGEKRIERILSLQKKLRNRKSLKCTRVFNCVFFKRNAFGRTNDFLLESDSNFHRIPTKF